MAVRYTPMQVNHGFDGRVSTNWQMVPCHGRRVLLVADRLRLQLPFPINPAGRYSAAKISETRRAVAAAIPN